MTANINTGTQAADLNTFYNDQSCNLSHPHLVTTGISNCPLSTQSRQNKVAVKTNEHNLT
jgi:hypothetical protein